MGQLDSRASDVGTRVLATASSIKRVADELRSDELSHGAASIADRGAETLERIGSYLNKSNGDTLVRDAERFSREQPWAIATTGIVLGLVGSRMLKASAESRHRDELRSSFGYGERDEYVR
ncbi:MAG: hypothetical protein NVSMB19_16420 [Vulcanimicrobiaceae bacterium]